jgi:tetratricopeptide (TPR) repeat protein
MSRPADARRLAEAVLNKRSATVDRIYALHALGIVERDSGHAGRAIIYFRRGMAASERAGLRDRKVDLAASLGTALAMSGRRHQALDAFDIALSNADVGFGARVLVRRCAARLMFGDPSGAFEDACCAADALARIDDPLWEANARHNAGDALVALGRFAAADDQYSLAQQLSESEGESYAATITLHSRGDCAHRRGDLPKALDLLYLARERYQRLGLVPPEIVRDLAVVLLAAGLTEEATVAADELVDVLDADRASAGRRADGLDHGGDSAP